MLCQCLSYITTSSLKNLIPFAMVCQALVPFTISTGSVVRVETQLGATIVVKALTRHGYKLMAFFKSTVFVSYPGLKLNANFCVVNFSPNSEDVLALPTIGGQGRDIYRRAYFLA